jgi:hypothetical protein
MKNDLEKNVEKIENQNSHFIFNKLLPKNRAACEKISKNVVEPGRPQMTIQCLRIAR